MGSIAPTDQIAIGYVHPGWVHEAFMDSLIRTLALPSQPTRISVRSGPLLSRARTELLETFLHETTCSHLLSVDTDMVWAPEDALALRLAAETLPIVGGLCLGQDPSGAVFAAASIIGKNGLQRLSQEAAERADGGALRVEGVGMAFTMISRECADVMLAHYKRPFEEGRITQEHVGEDIMFCLRAHERGFGTWVHTGVKIGHIKERVLRP